MNVTLNGVAIELAGESISYEQLADLAGYAPNRVPTVTYSSRERNGNLTAGQSADLVEGMHFNVVITGNA